MPWDLTTIPWIAYYLEPSITHDHDPIVISPCHTAPSLQDPNSRPLWTFHLALAPARTTNATKSAGMHTWRAGCNPQSTTFFGLMLKHQHRALETNTTPQTKPWTPAWHESSILPTYCKIVQTSGYAWGPMHLALVRRCKTTGSFRECHPQGLLEAFPWLWLPRCHPWTTDSMPDTLICGVNMNPRRAVSSGCTTVVQFEEQVLWNLSHMQMKVRSNKSIPYLYSVRMICLGPFWSASHEHHEHHEHNQVPPKAWAHHSSVHLNGRVESRHGFVQVPPQHPSLAQDRGIVACLDSERLGAKICACW